MQFHPAPYALPNAAGAAPVAPPLPPSPHAEAGWQQYVDWIWRARRLVLGAALVCALGAGLYCLAARPVYESNLLIHVEEERPNAARNIVTDVSSLFDTKKAAIAEMEVLRSRLVLGPAVDRLRLHIAAEPRSFPLGRFLLGERSARDTLAAPPLGLLGQYAWGGEQIKVAEFEVPAALQDQVFELHVGEQGRWVLSMPGAPRLLSGRVGEEARAQLDSGGLQLRVASLRARPGTSFYLRKQSRARAIAALQQGLAISEQGKQSGVIEVKLQGYDPERVTATLDHVAREYLRQHLARKTEDAGNTLAFLDQQLPALKSQLERAEASYNQFRSSHGTVNVGEEVRLSLERANQAKARRSELQLKRLELLGRFTDAHPQLAAVNAQLREAQNELTQQEAQIRALPMLEQEEARLAREVKVSQELYTALLNTAQQLRLLSAGQVSNVRLVDAPVEAEKPVRPNRPLVLALATLSGLFLGAILALLRRAVQVRIDDPEQLDAVLGAGLVYASIPHSQVEQRRTRQGRPRLPLLSQAAPDDPAVESLRALRTALRHAMPHCRNHVVCISGLHAGAGLHFVLANLASLAAASGQRVLLIDADVRGGRLHQVFGMDPVPGLTEVLGGNLPPGQAVCRQVREGLDLLPSGAALPSLADGPLDARFGELVRELDAHYDLVLVLAPPVMTRADALVLARHAAAVFLLARAGHSAPGQVRAAVQRLNQAGVLPHGIILNDTPAPPPPAGPLRLAWQAA
ncbi:GNVR domain-containing protein [Massilia sp. TS11]|uniref:GNVR domain-containing protein n=1 Tax=Massilia sp. TS11 TaxID=2908003 RepID=UPI001EDC4E84|nr:GNVR domain-containing protein [Massilia sp. TS11]MCG2584311.1 Wzz/FepE/Etk N-terminal domain-containing protein [Massilia sp. TS11]